MGWMERWHLLYVIAIGVGAGIGWCLTVWKYKAEIRRLKQQNQEWMFDMQVKSCASIIHFLGHQARIRAQNANLIFAESEFREWTAKAGCDSYVGEALKRLVKDGLAQEVSPGQWLITWSKSS